MLSMQEGMRVCSTNACTLRRIWQCFTTVSYSLAIWRLFSSSGTGTAVACVAVASPFPAARHRPFTSNGLGHFSMVGLLDCSGLDLVEDYPFEAAVDSPSKWSSLIYLQSQ